MSIEEIPQPGGATGRPEPPTADKLFTPAQLKFVRVVLLGVATVVLGGVVIVTLMGLAALVSTFRALLLPIAIAGVLALILNPLMDFMDQRLRLPRVLAASILTIVVVIGMGLIAWHVIPMILQQTGHLLERFPDFLNWLYFRLLSEWPDVTEALSSRLEEVEWVAMLPEPEGTMERLAGYASMAVGIGFVPFFLFFLLILGSKIEAVSEEATSLFSAETQAEVRYLVDVFVEYIAVFFRGQLLIALIMAIMFSVGFTLIGLNSAVVIGILLGMINIVPFLGTLVGLLTVLPLAYMQPGGGAALMVLALLIFVIVQLIESWVLTPKIMHDRSGLHPMIVVLSLFFWGALLGGILGMLLAVPLSAFVATLWHRTRYRYASKVEAPYTVISAGEESVAEARELRRSRK
jgi:predicted PurR-regulated permease PerM